METTTGALSQCLCGALSRSIWLVRADCCSFVSYRTSQYKLHYYETPTNIKFVMVTDVKSQSMRVALQQIYINLYVEYGMFPVLYECLIITDRKVVKNPLSPIEHPGGIGVNNELFEQSLEQFVVSQRHRQR